jgi:hypothetical protein
MGIMEETKKLEPRLMIFERFVRLTVSASGPTVALVSTKYFAVDQFTLMIDNRDFRLQ